MDDHGVGLYRALMGLHGFSFQVNLLGKGRVNLLSHDFPFVDKKTGYIIYRKIEWEFIAYNENKYAYFFRLISKEISPTGIEYEYDGKTERKIFSGRITRDYFKCKDSDYYRLGPCTYLLEIDDNFEKRILLNFKDDAEFYRITNQRNFQTKKFYSTTKACR